MPKAVRRSAGMTARKPLMEKLEQGGGLGGQWKPSVRNSQNNTYNEINAAINKVAEYGKDFTEGLFKEVFDWDISKYGKRAQRRTRNRKMRF